MGFIRRDLGLINLSKDSFEGIRDKMLGIADMLDGEIRQLGEQMMNDQLTIKELQEKISALETQLEDAKAQSREDFLTKTATRKFLRTRCMPLYPPHLMSRLPCLPKRSRPLLLLSGRMPLRPC